MKTTHNSTAEKKPAIRINLALNKYEDVVLFPEKLAKANEKLKKSGFPKLPGEERGR